MRKFICALTRRWHLISALIVCFAAGVLVGGLIFGKFVHLRFEPDWGDVATWLAVVVAAIGGGIALSQLWQQGKVIEGEVERNKRRDKLVDGQLDELQRRQVVFEREQAGKVGLSRISVATDTTVEIQLANESGRPIWDVECASVAAGSRVVAQADLAAELHLIEPGHGRPPFWNEYPDVARPGCRVSVVRAGGRAGFSFKKLPSALPDPVAVRFTDDAKRHWQVGENLHLESLPDRRDW